MQKDTSSSHEKYINRIRLMEEDECRVEALKKAIDEGMLSGIAYGFNPEAHLSELKSCRANG